jgi:hypothetical protein
MRAMVVITDVSFHYFLAQPQPQALNAELLRPASVSVVSFMSLSWLPFPMAYITF